MARNFTLNFPSTAFLPAQSTTGPTYTNHGSTSYSRVGLGFDDGNVESSITGMFVMPSEYTGTGTLKSQICFYTAGVPSVLDGSKNSVAAVVAFEVIKDGDSIDMESANDVPTITSFETITVPNTAGEPDVHTFTWPSTNKDSVAAGDIVRLIFARVASDGSDTFDGGDFYLASLSLYEET